jgi:hypothetical membrane protein
MNNKNETARSGGRRTSAEFDWAGFGLRLAATLVLVLATCNPSGWFYAHWLKNAFSNSGLGPEHFVAGIVILIGGLVWLLIDFGVLRIDSVSEFAWVILIILSVMLAIGLSWSHVWRRLTGQFEVDDD